MIKLHHVSKSYQTYRSSRRVLQQVDLCLERGDMALISGRSGSGKSTLFRLLYAAEKSSDGDVYFNDHNITFIPSKDIPFLRRNIGIIFQDNRLLSDQSVFENVALPMRIESMAGREVKRRVLAALDRTNLVDKAQLLPYQLSEGDQRRVGIARAVVNRPILLLADEPTNNLDSSLSNLIMKLLEDFNSAGVTVLIATHDFNLVSRRPQCRYLRLDKGFLREVEQGCRRANPR